jgi:hypothetical protein
MKKRNLKIIGVLSFITIILILSSYADASSEKFRGEFKVQMINCDGTITHEWTSSGKVQMTDPRRNGYYFNDKDTGKLIEITGRIIITKQ